MHLKLIFTKYLDFIISKFSVSVVELATVSCISFTTNILLIKKIGIAEFNKYALFISYTIILNATNLGFRLKIPEWLNKNLKIKITYSFLAQFSFLSFFTIILILFNYFAKNHGLTKNEIIIYCYIMVFSQQIDEIFHAYLRLSNYELVSFFSNTIGKLGIFLIIFCGNIFDAPHYLKYISVYLIAVILLKLIVFFYLKPEYPNYYDGNVTLLSVFKESKSTGLSGITNAIYNGISRAFIGNLNPVGILGFYTIISQIYAIIHSMLSIHLQQTYKKFRSVEKYYLNEKLIQVIVGLFIVFGLLFSLYQLYGKNSDQSPPFIIIINSILVIFITLNPLFSILKFTKFQFEKKLDKILQFNLIISTIGLFTMSLIYFLIPNQLLILLIMLIVGTLSNFKIHNYK